MVRGRQVVGEDTVIPTNRVVCASAATPAWTIGPRRKTIGYTASTFHSLLMAACFLMVRTKVAIRSRSPRMSVIMPTIIDEFAAEFTSSQLVPAQTSEP